MGVVAIDPTLWVDNIVAMQEDPRYEFIVLTGVGDLDSVEIYAAVLETLDSEAIRYGHMINENCIVMNVEYICDYLEELTQTLIEMTGISELDEADAMHVSEMTDTAGEVWGEGFEIEDESEAFQRMNYHDAVEELQVHPMLKDFIQSALEESIQVLTGGHKEIDANIILF